MKQTKLMAAAFLFMLCIPLIAEAHNSKAWQDRIDARTTRLWIEGQSLGDGIVLNARAQVDAVRIERNLMRELDRDRDVEEWLISSLGYYHSSRDQVREKMKGRDVLVLNYRAIKHWRFDLTKLVVNGHAITSENILRNIEDDDGEDLPPETTGTAVIAIPSMKAGQILEIRYGDDSATLKVPVR